MRLSTRTGPFKAQFPTPIKPTRMIVWLAEGALLSAIVDEVDMGFSCLLKSLSGLLPFARLPQRLVASDFVRHLARWRFQLKAYRHAVEGIHIGDDGG